MSTKDQVENLDLQGAIKRAIDSEADYDCEENSTSEGLIDVVQREKARSTSESAPEKNPENKKGSRTKPNLWEKGQSGNPGGRPKAEREVRELARQQGPRAIRRLVELMHSDNDRVSVAACLAILDRGYGKPLATVNNQGGPLVNINMNGNAPLTPAEAYRAICGDTSADISAITSRIVTETPKLGQEPR